MTRPGVPVLDKLVPARKCPKCRARPQAGHPAVLMSSCPAPSVPTKFSSALSSPDGDLISTGSAQRKLLGTSQSRQPCHRHLECRSRPTSRCRCALGHSKCQEARGAHRQCRRARHQHLECRSPPALRSRALEVPGSSPRAPPVPTAAPPAPSGAAFKKPLPVSWSA